MSMRGGEPPLEPGAADGGTGDPGDSGDLGEPPMEECPHCGRLVPVGDYCGNCGAHLPEGDRGPGRLHAYAAAPHEHVLQPAIVSTLFPHLPSRNAHGFRVALGLGLAAVAALLAFRLLAPATIAAALLLPVLYLLYLYDVEIYERQPVLAMAATFGIGALLGIGYAVVARHIARPNLGPGQHGLLVAGILLPVAAQVLMALPPLLLLGRPHFDDTLDGLTFGVASALGFTMAVLVVGEWSLLTAPLVTGVPVDDVLRLLRAGLLAGLVNASATGLITAALWFRRGRIRARADRREESDARRAPRWHGFWVSAGVALAVQAALGVAGFYIRSLTGLVALWAVAAAALLVWLRVVIHHALLEEGRDQPIGAPSPCPECHRLVPTMAFCPVCGAARVASPRRGRAGASQPGPAEASA